MNKIIFGIKDKANLLIERIQKREEIFASRSNVWKNSKKAEFYKESTEELKTIVEELNYIVKALKEWKETNQ